MKTFKKAFLYIAGFMFIAVPGAVMANIYPAQTQSFTIYGGGASIGATSVTLASFRDIGGTPLTMTAFGTMGFGTIDPGNGTQEESITWTGITQNADGTATLTGINSVAFVFPFTLTGNLTKAHSGGSLFVVSNTSYFYYRMLSILDNPETVTGDWHVPYPATSQSVVSRSYVDGAAFGGIGGASETATGTVQIATGVQAASSTVNGTIGRLALPASLATSTFNSATAGLKVVVTQNNGKIDGNFIPSLISSSTPFLNGIPLITIGENVQVFSTPGTSTFAIPSGVTRIKVRVVGAGGGSVGTSNGGTANASGGGGGGGYAEKYVDVSATTSVQVFVGTGGGDGTWSTFGTNGFYLSASGGKSGNVSSAGAGGIGSGGDLNVGGQGGGLAVSNNSGIGGSSALGGGGQSVNGTTGGIAGASYGGGASGCAAGSNQSCSGGSGGNGVVIINW